MTIPSHMFCFEKLLTPEKVSDTVKVDTVGEEKNVFLMLIHVRASFKPWAGRSAILILQMHQK